MIVTPDTPVGKPHASRFTLRDYQRDAVDAVLAARQDGRKRVLLVLPTGAGKTVVFSEIIARILDRGDR